MFDRPSKKSPLTEPIKRAAGQSGQERLDALRQETLVPTLLISIFMVALAAFEWFKYLLSSPPQPVVVTLVALGCIGWSVSRYRKLKTHFAHIRLGIDGEREVGQLLGELLPDAAVFHDIVLDKFNIDHAVIGVHGVYCVETKARSKGEGEKVFYDGKSVLVNGFAPDRDPLAQAQANSRALKKLIFDLTGQQVFVQPVVLFPGWFVELKAKNPDIWVLNPRQLPALVRQQTPRLSKEQIHVIATALKKAQDARRVSEVETPSI